MLKVMITAISLVSFLPAAFADTYPTKPIKMIVPWPPGGYADTLGRLVAVNLSSVLNQPVIVDNRGGSNGLIGTTAVAKSPADGYTVMLHSVTSYVSNPAFFKQMPYQDDDLTPVAIVASAPLMLVANESFPGHDLKSMIVLARKSKDRPLSVASFGLGSPSHLAIELLKQQAKIELLHVPYRGGGPALTDTLGGTVPLYFAAFGVAQPMVQQGKLRALAVSSKTRVNSLPNVPTVAEAANLPDFEMVVSYGLFVPKGTPADVQERLATEMQHIASLPEFQKRLAIEGASGPVTSTPSASVDFVHAESARITTLIKSANIKLD